jgi:hypothetical protein
MYKNEQKCIKETQENKRRANILVAHNPRVAGSNPAPATTYEKQGPIRVQYLIGPCFHFGFDKPSSASLD